MITFSGRASFSATLHTVTNYFTTLLLHRSIMTSLGFFFRLHRDGSCRVFYRYHVNRHRIVLCRASYGNSLCMLFRQSIH
jgi:hypothetical protein